MWLSANTLHKATSHVPCTYSISYKRQCSNSCWNIFCPLLWKTLGKHVWHFHFTKYKCTLISYSCIRRNKVDNKQLSLLYMATVYVGSPCNCDVVHTVKPKKKSCSSSCGCLVCAYMRSCLPTLKTSYACSPFTAYGLLVDNLEVQNESHMCTQYALPKGMLAKVYLKGNKLAETVRILSLFFMY